MNRNVEITWHSFAVRGNSKVVLCESLGDPVPKTFIGLWITPVREMVNCQNCLEWMHA